MVQLYLQHHLDQRLKDTLFKPWLHWYPSSWCGQWYVPCNRFLPFPYRKVTKEYRQKGRWPLPIQRHRPIQIPKFVGLNPQFRPQIVTDILRGQSGVIRLWEVRAMIRIRAKNEIHGPADEMQKMRKKATILLLTSSNHDVKSKPVQGILFAGILGTKAKSGHDGGA